MLIPIVVDQTDKGERSYDLYSRLMKDRIIILGKDIDDYVANVVVAQLLYLESVDSEADICLYINSPGGVIYAALAIYNTMNYIKPDVRTIAFGQACSAASLLLAAGTKGKRSALVDTEIMIHQGKAGIKGQFSDIKIETAHLIRIEKRLHTIYSELTGQSIEKIKKDLDRDNWMTAEEAKEYGLIDEVTISRRM